MLGIKFYKFHPISGRIGVIYLMRFLLYLGTLQRTDKYFKKSQTLLEHLRHTVTTYQTVLSPKLKNSSDTEIGLHTNSLFFSYSILKELQENLPDSVRQAKNNREN